METNSSLIILKLKTGENIIGMVSEETELEYIMHSVYLIVSEYIEKTKSHAISLVDWLPYTSDEFYPIKKSDVLLPLTPIEALEDHFYNIIASNMEPATAEIENPALEFLKGYKFKNNEKQ